MFTQMEVAAIKCDGCKKEMPLIKPNLDFYQINSNKVLPLTEDDIEPTLEPKGSISLCSNCYSTIVRLFEDVVTNNRKQC